jgi:hypothetical protein
MNKKIIFSGALLYLLIAPFFYHSDIKEIFYKAQFLSQGVINIYSFFSANPKLALFGPFAYQPLTYFVFGILFVPIRFIAGTDFVGWLAMGNDAVGVEHLFRYLLLMKIPVIVFFLLAGTYLARMFNDKKLQRIVLALWFFNPISIYVVGLIGQFDVVPSLLTLMALYYAGKKPTLASVLLGLGAALKSYPILLIPFLAITSKGSWISKLKIIAVGVITYLVFIVPFIGDPSFYQQTALSGLSQRVFIPSISFGFGEGLLIVPALYLGLLLYAINKDWGNERNLLKYFLSTTLLIVASIHFHPQWALWFLPFLLIQLVRNSNYKKAVYKMTIAFMVVGWFGTIFLLNDKFLTWGLFSLLEPAVFFLPTLHDLIKNFYSPLILQSLFHTVFLVSSASIILKTIYEKDN